jgi:hypothetical protein
MLDGIYAAVFVHEKVHTRRKRKTSRKKGNRALSVLFLIYSSGRGE